MNIRVEIRAGAARPVGVGDQRAADQQLLARLQIGELVREDDRLPLGDRDAGAQAGRLLSGAGSRASPGRNRTTRIPAMSWTTVGVFSFWPTRITSPGFASGWLASTTRLT